MAVLADRVGLGHHLPYGVDVSAGSGMGGIVSREVINGVLHVILTPKRHDEGVLDALFRHSLEEAGIMAIDYYPPTYFILSEQTIGERRADDREWRQNNPFQFQFRGRPKALSPELRGHKITVKATVEAFFNGLGGYLNRPEIVEVGEYVECPHHDDSYNERIAGSSRVFCRTREKAGSKS